MRYHNITKDDMLNGDGLRVVLWVAGCSHGCKDCQNPITWDPQGGLPFTEEEKKEIFQYLDVVVDGKFISAQKDITLPWRGSSNQKVIDVPSTLKEGKIVLQEE